MAGAALAVIIKRNIKMRNPINDPWIQRPVRWIAVACGTVEG
jgi:hypothetical protein